MKKIILGCLLAGVFGQPLQAALINEMQACQGLIHYLQQKLEPAPAKYPSDKVWKIQQALKQYDQYIQEKIITPGLLDFNGGDASKAEAMQQQVNVYKNTITQGLQARDGSENLTSNYAVSLNNCAKQAVPSGQALENLKYAINTIVDLAKSN